MSAKQKFIIAICAGWPLVALPIAAHFLYSGAPGAEPYFLIALGAVMECATCAIAIWATFGGKTQ